MDYAAYLNDQNKSEGLKFALDNWGKDGLTPEQIIDKYTGNISSYLKDNKDTLTSSQLQADMAKYGVSAADIGKLYGVNDLGTPSSAIKGTYTNGASDGYNWATHGWTAPTDKGGLGLDTNTAVDRYYGNINNYVDDKSHSAADIAAAQAMWGVSDADIAEARRRKSLPKSNLSGELGDSGLLMDDWKKTQYPWLINQLNTATDMAHGAADQFNYAGKAAMDDYDKIFRPSYQKLSDFVNRYGDEGFRASQRGQAMEGMDAQFNAQDDALRRRFQGMGTGSGAMADALASNASARAMAKVQAATQSDNNLDQMYGNGLSGMANLGLKVGEWGNNNLKNAVNAVSAPMTWGQDIFKTGGALQSIDNTMKLGVLNAANQDYANRQNAGVNWYNAASNRMNAMSNQQNANTNASANNSNNDWFQNMAGAAGGAAINSFFKDFKWG